MPIDKLLLVDRYISREVNILIYKNRSFEIGFDFISHQFQIETSARATKQIALVPRAAADFTKQ